MKKISILLLGVLMTTAAIAQNFKHEAPFGKQTDHYKKSRSIVNRILNKPSQHQAKSTASYERMIGFTDYGWNQNNQWVIFDSASMSYSGMNGSGFNFTSMSIGYFSPVFGPIIPGDGLSFMSDSFKVYQNNNSSSLVISYAFTYDGNNNITEVYLANYSGGPDERILMSYNGTDPVYTEYLRKNGSNWDTVNKRYFTYSNNLLVEDSVLEHQNNNWVIVQKYQYSYDLNGNITSLKTWGLDNNSVYNPLGEDYYTYDGNDNMVSGTYYVYNDVQMNMMLDSKDTFEYTTGVDFYTKDTYYTWDTAALVWDAYGYQEKHLNGQLLPDTVSVYDWNDTTWVPSYVDCWQYTSYGNPTHDTLLSYTAGVLDEDPGYVGHYYYQHYWDLNVKNQAAAPVVNVYPNPADDILNVSSDQQGKLHIQMHDALGRNVKTISTTGQARFSIADLPSGIYLLTVTDDHSHKVSEQKIIKQ